MKSQYKGVIFDTSKHHGRDRLENKWVARCKVFGQQNKGGRSSRHATEREAAIAYDKMLIELGRKPVNILKPKL